MKKNEIFTVENAKVANVQYNWYNPGRKGYIHDGDGIVAVRVDSVTFDLKNQEVTTILLGNDGMGFVRKGSFAMYERPSDFEVDNAIRKFNSSAVELIRNRAHKLYDCDFCCSTEDDKEYVYVNVWRFEDGDAVKTPVAINVIRMTEGRTEITDSTLPERFWKNRELAFMNNEYKVVDEEGEEFTEVGVQKRISLTEEQEAIISEMKALFKKAKDANVLFAWDRDCCNNLEAFNGEYVDDYGYEANTENGGDDVMFRDVEFYDTGISFYDYNRCESEYILAMKPTARQKKAWLKKHPENA